MKKFVVGITGGIASGKTVMTDILASLGEYIIDADVVSRKTQEFVKPQLMSAFPDCFDGGELNRVALRNRVFSNKEELEKLNAITHPAIEGEMSRLIGESERSLVFVVAPILFETGWSKLCDYVVCVTAGGENRIERLKKRNNTITDEVARAIVAAQMSDEERERRSDEVVFNDGTIEQFNAKVLDFYRRIKETVTEK